jgi:hypothetical protein
MSGMQDDFADAAAPLSEAEKALKSWGVEYEKQADGTILVPGNIDISWKGIPKLPDISNVKVIGNFSCTNNELTSLEGAPFYVGGDFNCANNQITSLKHAPQYAGGFGCDNNRLTTLEGGPVTVGDFGYFCSDNRLTSLHGAPETVEATLFCHNNPLTSLEGAPKKFKSLNINLDSYSSWDEVPEELKTSPETKARMAEERAAAQQKALAEAIIDATVLRASVKVGAPMKFKSGVQPASVPA